MRRFDELTDTVCSASARRLGIADRESENVGGAAFIDGLSGDGS